MLALRSGSLSSVAGARLAFRLSSVRLASSSSSSAPTSATDVSPLNPITERTLEQAPNRATTWAPSQKPKSEAQVGPRFVQRDLALQPNPPAAIELIAKEPVRYVDAEAAVCDGDKGSQQGHPRIYIDIEQPGTHACLYCGSRYANTKFQAEIEAGSA